ncbi:hypothetical protein IEQ44_04865 [Nocardioides sp. Y6]|uniref:Lipoprotein n=1 Tax=Nocardioides malaquae TaxID=2773426 RepID=A0ABR9RQY1_9ACTN|nr:hypothetical protein [Nocardioides malaquae]MBE7323980.1 hypothetical protein [Nocardioides malaquae]
MTIFVGGRRALALTCVVALAASGCSRDAERGSDADPDGASTGATSSVSPTPTPGATAPRTPGGSSPTERNRGPGIPGTVPPEVVTEAEEGVDEYVSQVGDALGSPSTEEELTLAAVTGAALEELRNRVAEYEASGWRVVGEPRVVRHRVVRYRKGPESVVVRACIDNSDVRVVDSEGQTVPGSLPAKPRTLNVLTLVRAGEGWAVSEQRLAPQPDC